MNLKALAIAFSGIGSVAGALLAGRVVDFFAARDMMYPPCSGLGPVAKFTLPTGSQFQYNEIYEAVDSR
jgi:hypothetical protein